MIQTEVHPIEFGRWLLKECEITFDQGTLCWNYLGTYYDTDELYQLFLTKTTRT